MANSIPDKEKAIEIYHETIEIAEKRNLTEILIGTYNNLACTYIEDNKLLQAKECLRDHAIPLALKYANKDWLSTLYESYAELFEKKEDFHQAYVYQKKALKSRIEASEMQSASQLHLLNALFMAKNREMEIKEKSDELQVKHHQIITLISLLFVLILIIITLAVISLWWIQRKNLKLKIQEINTAKRLNLIEEKEYERLSMQLHDAIRPLSSVLQNHIETMDFPDQDMKESMTTKLTETTRHLRQISHRMNPLMREQMTFTELIRSIREDFNDRPGFITELRLPETDPVLSIETVNQLYFIIQELMMNAGKHVKSGKVGISISEEYNNLYIIYEDDGPGFDQSSAGLSGLGLMHIFERAKLLNGKAVLDTSPGQGTRWTISVPVK